MSGSLVKARPRLLSSCLPLLHEEGRRERRSRSHASVNTVTVPISLPFLKCGMSVNLYWAMKRAFLAIVTAYPFFKESNLMTIPKLPGQAPTPEQEQMIQDIADHWRRVNNEAPMQAITRTEEAAKQLIGLNAALQGIFFAVFAFSDLRNQIGAMHLPLPNGLILLLFFIS